MRTDPSPEDDSADADADADAPAELPEWERDLNERALRWARGADRPGHPSRRTDDRRRNP